MSGLYTVCSSAYGAFAAFAILPLQSVLGAPAIFVMVAFLIPIAMTLLRWFPTEAPVRPSVRRVSTVDTKGKAVIVVGMMLYYVGLGGYWPFVGVIGGRCGVSPETVSIILGAAGVTSIGASLIAVLFGDRSRSSLLICVLLAAGVVAVAGPLAVPSSVTVYVVSTCMVIFSWFAAFPFLLGLMSRLDPSGRMNGLLYVVAAIGFAFGPAIAGWLIDHDPDPLIGARLLQQGALVCLAGGSVILGCDRTAPGSPVARAGDLTRRATQSPVEPPRTVGFLLLPDLILLSYAASVEPLRAANDLTGRTLYEWKHVTLDGAAIRARTGTVIEADCRVGDACKFDLLVIASAGVSAKNPVVSAWLRRLAREGTRIAGIAGGVHVMARAGLLDGYRCAVHWAHAAAFREEFPTLSIEPALFVLDRGRLTCSGSGAASGPDPCGNRSRSRCRAGRRHRRVVVAWSAAAGGAAAPGAACAAEMA